MRKEILGIVLFFLVVFTLISLLSYSPSDPSIHHAGPQGEIHNLFGVLGAHFAGLLMGLFGMGAFWLPFLLFFTSLHVFAGHPPKPMLLHLAGGVLLIIASGALLALKANDIEMFGTRFSSGGIVGFHLKAFLVHYTNFAGGAIILAILWLIGFILATGFSLIRFARRFWRFCGVVTVWTRTLALKWLERSRKAKKRLKARKEEEILPRENTVKIKTAPVKPVRTVPAPKQQEFDFMTADTGFRLPSVNFLDEGEVVDNTADAENLRMQSRLLEKKLEDFGVKGQVATITPGPVVTTFEYEPAPGVKINKIVNLSDDLALTLRATSIRIVAPIPGKAAIGIEIPNPTRQVVRFKEIVVSSAFEKSKSKLTLCLGKDIVGHPVAAELDRMPHLLIAGATGSGKSVALNAMICSFLYKATPEEVQFIMIDPKRIELSIYRDIPHLITPVVTDPKKATYALFWAVREMERRYELLSEKGAKNVKQYNQILSKEDPPKDPEAESPPEKLSYNRHHHRRTGGSDDGGLAGGGSLPDPAGPDGPGRRNSPDSGHPAAFRGRAHRHHQSQFPDAPDVSGIVQDRFAHHHRRQRCRKSAGQRGYALFAPRHRQAAAYPRGLYFRSGDGPHYRLFAQSAAARVRPEDPGASAGGEEGLRRRKRRRTL